MQFRDLEKQYQALKGAIDAAVLEVMASGCYIGGSQVVELEKQLADYVGVRHCISCANGTDALQLALMAWDVGSGDAVFVPDFTFFSSGEVVAAVGATPVFVDVDERNYNIDPTKLETAITEIVRRGELNPRVVIAVDLFGLPADYSTIRPLCEKYGILLLEDGAQGFGGSMRSKMACSFGDISTTSFFPAKPLGCYGDGGAVFTDSDEWAGLIRSYAVHGKGTMKYDNVRVGMNSRLDALQAAILLVKLEAFKAYELERVRRCADWYDDALVESGLVLPKRFEGFTSSWAQYTVQLPDNAARTELQMALKNKGIPTAVYYPKPMHEQLAFSGNCITPAACAVSERLSENVLSLPIGPYITNDDVLTVASSVIDAIPCFS